MKKSLILKTIILSNLFFSCISMNRNHDASLEKVWKWDRWIGSAECYKTGLDINDDKSGIQFLSDGILKVRQNEGWCGTEPISYETVSGSWSKTSDSTIKLIYPYWGGKIIDDIVIVKVSKSELHIKSINTQY